MACSRATESVRLYFNMDDVPRIEQTRGSEPVRRDLRSSVKGRLE
jgi:hypothetical protein